MINKKLFLPGSLMGKGQPGPSWLWPWRPVAKKKRGGCRGPNNLIVNTCMKFFAGRPDGERGARPKQDVALASRNKKKGLLGMQEINNKESFLPGILIGKGLKVKLKKSQQDG